LGDTLHFNQMAQNKENNMYDKTFHATEQRTTLKQSLMSTCYRPCSHFRGVPRQQPHRRQA